MKTRKSSLRDRAFVSFFSGAMGLDLGLEAAGLDPLAANEFDPVICETIRKNRPRLRLYGQDIRILTDEPRKPAGTH